MLTFKGVIDFVLCVIMFIDLFIDLLHFGYFWILYIHITEWIYCSLDIVHILEQIVQLCKLSEYLQTDILYDWI